MTTRLYDTDSHLCDFTARVLSCRPHGAGYAAELDRTAFFPGGGGQAADTGTLAGEPVAGFFCQEERIFHLIPVPLEPGETVRGLVDWEPRFRRMQAHSGEHIISGIIHSEYGFENTGFHMGAEGVIVDFSGYLTREQLERVQLLANRVVWSDAPVRVFYPTPEELPGLAYRSKADLEGTLRLVSIQGCDLCACCAPHVLRTGEVGVIRILESIRHKGGTRLRLLCGRDAMADLLEKGEQNRQISALLSAPETDTAVYVQRLLGELDAARKETDALRLERVLSLVRAQPETPGSRCLFLEGADLPMLRAAVNAAVPLCGGVAGAFSPDPGGEQTRYVVGSAHRDVRALAPQLNRALSGRGGGTPEMIQGSVRANRAEIEAFFANL